MNERIKQCWLTAARQDNGYKWDSQEEFIERFAELIIKESIKVMMENDYHGEWLGEKLKEHFGVEE